VSKEVLQFPTIYLLHSCVCVCVSSIVFLFAVVPHDTFYFLFCSSSYYCMTTAWPASFVMKLLGWLTPSGTGVEGDATAPGRDPYEIVQAIFSVLGILWVIFLGPVTRRLAALPDDAWRTHLLDGDDDDDGNNKSNDKKTKIKNKTTTKITNRKRNKNLNDISGGSLRMGAMESGVDLSSWKEAKNDGKIE
jgi:hypothetical protein